MTALRIKQSFEIETKNQTFRPPFLASKTLATDLGPQERWRHGRCVIAPASPKGALVARAVESQLLDLLQEKGQICAQMHAAGLRFKRSYLRAGLAGPTGLAYAMIKVNYSPHSSELERTDTEEQAYKQWRQAMKAVRYPYNDMLVTAICYEVPLPPVLYAKFLQALKSLATHYYGPPQQQKQEPM